MTDGDVLDDVSRGVHFTDSYKQNLFSHNRSEKEGEAVPPQSPSENSTRLSVVDWL